MKVVWRDKGAGTMDVITPSLNCHDVEDIPKRTWRSLLGDTMLGRLVPTLFIGQTAILILLDTILYMHFDMTKDFMEVYQAWFLVAHGQLNPYLMSVHEYFWQNHLEWIMWSLALLYSIYPHGITLLTGQDVATVAATAVAFGMIRDIVKRLCTLEAFFVTAAAWQFSRQHVLWGYVFVALCFITSDVSVTYLAVVSVLLLLWRQWRDGIVVGLLGLLGLIGEQHFFYHDLGGVGFFWSGGADALPPHSIKGLTFSVTMAVLVGTAQKSFALSRIVGALVVAKLLGWFVVGVGLRFRTPLQTVDASNTLQHLRHTISAGAKVMGSQTIIGHFAAHQNVHTFAPTIPIESKMLDFIVAPYQGIRQTFPAEELMRIAYLGDHWHAHPLTDHGNVWTFRRKPPSTVCSLSISNTKPVLPAWPLKTAVECRILPGAATCWHLATDGSRAGDVMEEAYWLRGRRTYQAYVSLQSKGPIHGRVWNGRVREWLARKTFGATHGRDTLWVAHTFSHHRVAGTGPFHYQSVPPTLKVPNNIEGRVWTPRHETVSVYRVGITKTGYGWNSS